MMIGAVLTQNTAWIQVENAIRNLRAARALSFHTLHHMKDVDLAALIRPAGYFNIKARRLRALAALVMDSFRGDVSALWAQRTEVLRATLLAVNGVGPETADCIVLYAAHRPVFVVDAYTRRFLERHGWLKASTPYHEVAALFTSSLPPDEKLFNEYHALIVRLGKEHCRKSRPRCIGCPLQKWLKENPVT